MSDPIELIRLTPDVYVLVPRDHGGWGRCNSGVVLGDATALQFDTAYDGPANRVVQQLAASVLRSGTRVDTVVNSHANGDHSYGNCLYPEAEIVSTEANRRHVCLEPAPADLARLTRESDPHSALGHYLRRHFEGFDFTGLEVVEPTRTFSGELELMVGTTTVRLLEVGPAHTAGDLIMHLPQHGILFAGDVIFNGDHPVHWAGPLEEIHRACEQILALQPHVVVPGHGPVITNLADVRAQAVTCGGCASASTAGMNAGGRCPRLQPT